MTNSRANTAFIDGFLDIPCQGGDGASFLVMLDRDLQACPHGLSCIAPFHGRSKHLAYHIGM
jgi:hypothetical protein